MLGMKNSDRGSVDPFIVMDVMEAASKKENLDMKLYI